MTVSLTPPVFCCLNCGFPKEHVLDSSLERFVCPACDSVLLDILKPPALAGANVAN